MPFLFQVCPGWLTSHDGAEAIEDFLSFDKGSFLAAYRDNIADGNAYALDSSPVAQALHYFIKKNTEFRGSAVELQEELRRFCIRKAAASINLGRKH